MSNTEIVHTEVDYDNDGYYVSLDFGHFESKLDAWRWMVQNEENLKKLMAGGYVCDPLPDVEPFSGDPNQLEISGTED